MARTATELCPCGTETFVICDGCDRYYCTACVGIEHLSDDQIRATREVWCLPCQRREFIKAQHCLSEKARSSQAAIEECLRTRRRVPLTSPSTPRSFDEVMLRLERFSSLLHVEPYVRDESADVRFLVVGKDHDIESPKAWNAISLIATYLLNVPTWIDPPTAPRVLDMIDGARRTGESFVATRDRLVADGEITYDEAYIVPQFVHDVEHVFSLPSDEPLVKCMCNQLIQRVIVRRAGAFDFTTGQRCNALAPSHDQREEPTSEAQALMGVLLDVVRRHGTNVGRRDQRFRRRRAGARAGRFVLG